MLVTYQKEMAAMTDPRLKQIRIKTGVLRRLSVGEYGTRSAREPLREAAGGDAVPSSRKKIARTASCQKLYAIF